MLILPAIDLRAGRCVRLTQGDYAREKVYDTDPAAVAKSFEDNGAEYLHVVDLDGAKAGSPQNLESLQAIRAATEIPIEFGGGIRSLETARALLALGVDRIIVGTKLVQDEELSRRLFQELSERVVAGVDAKNGKVAVAGWIEASEVDAFDFVRALHSWGAMRVIATDIARDGALTGPNIEFLRGILAAADIKVIASGGIANLHDFHALKSINSERLEGVIVGKALYESCFTLEQALHALA